ncbi:MAG: alpha-L-fucosidase [Cytophagaceae bacterium]|nr:alpha-L-fucosidase [Cytophagaceae bacterium]MBL0301254.1 alpha-L-fucosidase [Cytophagaceae bacterium]MBL0324071.1 alpha-L-fucosidase [Cytophagaceae bacterium]
MNTLKTLFFILILNSALAQNTLHPSSNLYEYPKDPLVAQKLEQWREQKFGMIIHWGVYAVPGIIESWSICNEDWITRDSASRYDDYKKWYWGLSEKFNPTKFDPDQWAQAAKNAGMKYVVFTTKHHDGFNMFDTQFSDYKISNGPFKENPKADVAKYVFDAFRKQNMMIGAYYSKPDWHSQYFWWDLYATPNRNVNYDIRKHPWRWNQFINYTHNQIDELTSKYGNVDILWLDGGWVRPRSTVTEEVLAWGAPIPDFDQEINMPKLAEKARKNQPGILIVDRTVHGEFENYRTPEQAVPKVMSHDPWESCITLGGAWSYVPNDQFKSTENVIHLLVEIVAKGGNLLLGVGPTPEGLLLDEQIKKLEEIGNWLKINGEGIYETRAIDNFKNNSTYFTASKDGKLIYAIQLLGKETQLTETVQWEGKEPTKNSKMYILGQEKPLKWEVKDGKITVKLPIKIVETLKSQAAVVFKYSVE